MKRNPPTWKGKRRRKREREKISPDEPALKNTVHYSRVSSDEDAINPDPVPPPLILVSPSGVSCSYPPGLSIFHLAGFTFGRRHRRPVLSFDDRSRGCSQLQLQFPGSPAPERSAAISLSLFFLPSPSPFISSSSPPSFLPSLSLSFSLPPLRVSTCSLVPTQQYRYARTHLEHVEPVRDVT